MESKLNEVSALYKVWRKINERLVRSIYEEMDYQNYYGYLMFFDCILGKRWDDYVGMN